MGRVAGAAEAEAVVGRARAVWAAEVAAAVAAVEGMAVAAVAGTTVEARASVAAVAVEVATVVEAETEWAAGWAARVKAAGAAGWAGSCPHRR